MAEIAAAIQQLRACFEAFGQSIRRLAALSAVALVHGYPAKLSDRRKARGIARRTGIRFSVVRHRGRRLYIWPAGVRPLRLDPPAGLRSWQP